MAKQGQARILSKKEQNQVIKSLSKSRFPDRDRCIFLLSFKAGLRAKEIAEVTLSDFVHEVKPISVKTIYVSRELMKSDFYIDADIKKTVTLRKEVTKGSKIEKCHIVNKELRQALLDYLNSGTRSVMAVYAHPHQEEQGDRALFGTNKSNGFSANGVSHLFMALSKKSGVPFTSHAGRRSLCTQLVQDGHNMFDVQALMRHKDISTTQLYYQKDEVRLGSIMESL